MYPVSGELSDALILGQCYHYTMEVLVKHYTLTKNVEDVYDVIHSFMNIYNVEISEDILQKIIVAVNETFAHVISNYIIVDENDVERSFDIPRMIRGKIDLYGIEGSSRVIIDYKSSRYALFDAESKLQLSVYYYGLYNTDDEFKDYVDEGGSVLGVIIAPFLADNVQYSTYELKKSDLEVVENAIGSVHEYINALVEKYKNVETIDELLFNLLKKEYLMSGDSCRICDYQTMCPYGFSIKTVDNIYVDKLDNIEHMDINNLIDNYKILDGKINNLTSLKSDMKTKIMNYMYSNSLNKIKSENGHVAAFRESNDKRMMISPFALFKEVGEDAFNYMTVDINSIIKSNLMSIKAKNITHFKLHNNVRRYLVVR
jgi:hypothetical protein